MRRFPAVSQRKQATEGQASAEFLILMRKADFSRDVFFTFYPTKLFI